MYLLIPLATFQSFSVKIRIQTCSSQLRLTQKYAFNKNPQFVPNHYETQSKWGTHEYLILTKFRNDYLGKNCGFFNKSISLGQSGFASACLQIQILWFCGFQKPKWSIPSQILLSWFQVNLRYDLPDLSYKKPILLKRMS